MAEFLLIHEPQIRLISFAGLFAVFAMLEFVLPRKARAQERRLRWTNNLVLVVVNTALLRVLIPTAAVGFAILCGERGWGLFNLVELPPVLEFVAALLLLDFAIYLQHLTFHIVPLFWRLHRVHHADVDLDVTTGLRFHPGEIILSMLIKLGLIFLIGPAAVVVLVFEVILNATSMFNHSNIYIPVRLDRVLRLVLVTPDMHRVHHSVIRHETNSNFGFNIPWWDWLCRTYRAQPEGGHDDMTTGLDEFRRPRDQWLDQLLIQPLRSNKEVAPNDR